MSGSTTTSTTTTAASVPVGVAIKKHWVHPKVKHIAKSLPLFAFVVFLFVIMKVTVDDVRALLFSAGGYKLSAVEIFYYFTFTCGMAELLRVSHPGVDNTREAMFMLAVAVGSLMLFLAANLVSVSWMQMFATTEFGLVVVASGTQSIVALYVNARTLKRTVDFHDQQQ